MGTHGLWGVKKNGVVRAQYYQYGSYFDHLGFNFLLAVAQGNIEEEAKGISRVLDSVDAHLEEANADPERQKEILEDYASLEDARIFWREEENVYLNPDFDIVTQYEYGYLADFDAGVIRLQGHCDGKDPVLPLAVVQQWNLLEVCLALEFLHVLENWEGLNESDTLIRWQDSEVRECLEKCGQDYEGRPFHF